MRAWLQADRGPGIYSGGEQRLITILMATGAHSDSTCTPITGPMPHALISGSVPLRDHTALCCWFRGSSGLLRIQSGIHSNDSGEKLVTGF